MSENTSSAAAPTGPSVKTESSSNQDSKQSNGSNGRDSFRGGRGRDGGRGRGRGNHGNGRGGGGRGGGRGRGASRGRGNDRPFEKRQKEMGRNELLRGTADKRKRIEDDAAAKRQRIAEGGEPSYVGITYSAEDIAAEDRKPKKKVAVMIGYAGTGYKGMQLNDKEKTIEGDLFNAFVKAGAISKANADDPKKSSLVRCARTDKGVHAAGNVVSLKLIVEDEDIVKKINDNLPEQIRVWGYERVNNSFSCYQSCDSRWYEYLIPTYSFLPPHPDSWLGKKIVESAQKEGVFETFQSRQEEVSSFWERAEQEYIEPILSKLDPELRAAVREALHTSIDPESGESEKKADLETESKKETSTEEKAPESVAQESVPEQEPVAQAPLDNVEMTDPEQSVDAATAQQVSVPEDMVVDGTDAVNTSDVTTEATNSEVTPAAEPAESSAEKKEDKTEEQVAPPAKTPRILTPLDIAVAEVKAAYIKAKKAYRIAPARRTRVQEALNKYLGTRNFHNYTIRKTFKDPSAKRVIRSFNVGAAPIIINNTEWLSLKVHGQSFMMHQIRKMVAMAALVVRTGCDPERIPESYGADKISIPKAPSLGLLLERPVFDSYNERAVRDFEKEKIDFNKYETEMEAFKQKHIYERLFEVENEENQYHIFFHHVDNFKSSNFLFLTAEGIPAVKQANIGNQPQIKEESDDEGDVGNEEG